jgi:pyrimidine operon attenuation protein/uracil phosphoribosyltransferase
MPQEKQVLLEHEALGRTVARMSHEIIDQCGDPAALVLIGIRSRGVYLARRIARNIEDSLGTLPMVSVLDITPYRDDRARNQSAPAAGAFDGPVAVDGKTVVLVDDVIFRGRTIRAALEAVAQCGQPRRILVAVLIDRGARELPIRADIVGKNVQAGEDVRINVLLEESDGIDQVTMARWQGHAVP